MYESVREVEIIDSRENLIRLINQYQNLIFSICLKMTGDYFTAEDITQETFLAAFKHWDSFDGANEKTWICRIATNKCIDFMRGAARSNVPLDEDVANNMVDPSELEHEVMNKQIMDEFSNAIDELEEPYRSVAKSHFVDGKTAKEISISTDIGLKTIQTQLFRAKNMLKQYIRKEDLIT